MTYSKWLTMALTWSRWPAQWDAPASVLCLGVFGHHWLLLYEMCLIFILLRDVPYLHSLVCQRILANCVQLRRHSMMSCSDLRVYMYIYWLLWLLCYHGTVIDQGFVLKCLCFSFIVFLPRYKAKSKSPDPCPFVHLAWNSDVVGPSWRRWR